MRRIPLADKFAFSCVVCGTALDGILGWLFNLFGIGRSTRNPNVCNRCDAHLQEGRVVELSILFADLTGFTEMTNRLGADRTYEVLESFFKMANEVLVKNDAFIDKYIGDAVMAFFNAPIQNVEHARKAASAAMGIQDGLKSLAQKMDLNLRARIGIACGYARVGRLGSADRKDYTAIGDAVNLASRLESFANPGEIMMDERAFAQLSSDYPNLRPETLTVRGFVEPIRAYRLGEALEINATRPVQVDSLALRRNASLGTVLFAIFGAPCAALTILSPLAIVLGMGAMLSSITPALGILDVAPVRIPLQMFALTGAATNLYVIRRGKSRLDTSGGDELTLHEKRIVAITTWLSITSFLAVAIEVYAHIFIHGQPYF
jgi:class 3 adenylate cyclase